MTDKQELKELNDNELDQVSGGRNVNIDQTPGGGSRFGKGNKGKHLGVWKKYGAGIDAMGGSADIVGGSADIVGGSVDTIGGSADIIGGSVDMGGKVTIGGKVTTGGLDLKD